MTASSSQSATVSVERSSQNTSANAPAASSTAGTTVAPPSERPRHARSSRGPSAVPRPVTSNLVSDLLSDTPALLPPPLIPLPPGSDPSVANDLVMLSDDVPVGGASGSTRTKTDSGKSSRKRDDAECAICLEKEPDSALYPCGHMCMCYECAVSVKNQRSALCPMCRQPIVDILRIYRN